MNIYKIEAILNINRTDVKGEFVFDGLERFKHDDFDVLIKVLIITFTKPKNKTKIVGIKIYEKCTCCTDYSQILAFDDVETLCRVGQVFENIMSNHVKSSNLENCLKLGSDRTRFNKNLDEKFNDLFENKEFGIHFLEGEEN